MTNDELQSAIDKTIGWLQTMTVYQPQHALCVAHLAKLMEMQSARAKDEWTQ